VSPVMFGESPMPGADDIARVYRVISGWIDTFTPGTAGMADPDCGMDGVLHPAASIKIPVMARTRKIVCRVIVLP